MTFRSCGRGAAGFLSAALLALAFLAAQAAAQGPAPSLADLSVALWPEYDSPEMLVIFRGELAADVPLPATVEWRIPAAAGGPSALAANDPEQGLLNLTYTSRQEGDWLVLVFELDTSGFQVEYYAPLAQSGDERSYAFTYPADYAVAAFILSAQQPRTAQEFSLDPPASSTSPGTDGLVYHEVGAAPIAQGETKTWSVRYLKTDDLLSGETQSSAAAPTPPPAQDAGEGSSALWIFVTAFVALVAVGAGAFWLGRRSGPAPEGRESEAVFCHVCGARVPRDARFCSKCSAPVRDR